MTIKQPANKNGLTFNTGFSAKWTETMNRVQKMVDSEVLRYCDPLTPKQTGALINSGKMGTVLGSGEVKYTAPYAANQYYNTAETRSYDPRRGGRWFERMKVAHGKAILKGAKKALK